MAVGRWQLAGDSWQVAVGRWQLAQRSGVVINAGILCPHQPVVGGGPDIAGGAAAGGVLSTLSVLFCYMCYIL